MIYVSKSINYYEAYKKVVNFVLFWKLLMSPNDLSGQMYILQSSNLFVKSNTLRKKDRGNSKVKMHVNIIKCSGIIDVLYLRVSQLKNYTNRLTKDNLNKNWKLKTIS